MLKEVRGGASRLDLTTDLTAASLTLAATGPALANWPTGTIGPFVIRIDDELLLCANRAGDTITVAQRGWDSTAPASHNAGSANVRHVIDADSIADALGHIYKDDRDDHSQYMKVDGSRPFDDVSGMTDPPLSIAVENLEGIQSNLSRSDHQHKIDDGFITNPLLADDVVDTRVLAPDAVIRENITDDALHSEHYADASILEPHIGDDQLSARMLPDGIVHHEHLDPNAVLQDRVGTPFRFTIVCTSVTRPADATVSDGDWLFETDTQRALQRQAGAWVIMDEPIQTYTPVITASFSPLSLGNGTLTGYSRRTGPFCDVMMVFVCGSTTGGGAGGWTFSLPYPSAGPSFEQWLQTKIGSITTGTYMGLAILGTPATVCSPYFPLNATTSQLFAFQQTDGSGSVGTGVPRAAGVYPISTGANLLIWGRYRYR